MLKFYPDDWFRVKYIASDLSTYFGLHGENVSDLNWIRSTLGTDRPFVYIIHSSYDLAFNLLLKAQDQCASKVVGFSYYCQDGARDFHKVDEKINVGRR